MNNKLSALIPFLAKPILSRIHKFKDSHRGESCYLIGDGVSVKWFDLGAFNDKTAIPCGFIPFHNDFKKLNVQYLSVAEPWWFYPTQRTTTPPIRLLKNPIQLAYRNIISENPDKEFFANLSNYPVLRQNNITYMYRDIYDARLPKDFISRRINSFQGSLRVSILLAIYLGFERCYLVGYDYTHVPSRSLHWYEKGQGVFCDQPNYQQEFFQIAQQYIDITTITLDGKTDYINAVTYKEHTGRDPVYRENTELLSEEYLKILASWPGYKIY